MSFRAGIERGKHTKLHTQDNNFNSLRCPGMCTSSNAPRVSHVSEQESFVLHTQQANFVTSSSNLSTLLNNVTGFRQQTRNRRKKQLEPLAPGASSESTSSWYWVRLLPLWLRQQSHASFWCQYKLFFRITKPNIPDKLTGKLLQGKHNRHISKIHL